MELSLGQWLAIGVSAVLLAGYIWGYMTNRNKGEMVTQWLQAGLSNYGKVVAGERLSGMSTGGSLRVNSSKGTLRSIEAIYILEPRENLVFWIFYVINGRRDELVMRITTQSTLKQEVDIARQNDKDFEKHVGDDSQKNFKIIQSEGNLQVAIEGDENAEIPTSLQEFLNHNRHAIYRLAIRRTAPQIFIRMRLSELLSEPSTKWITALQELTM